MRTLLSHHVPLLSQFDQALAARCIVTSANALTNIFLLRKHMAISCKENVAADVTTSKYHSQKNVAWRTVEQEHALTCLKLLVFLCCHQPVDSSTQAVLPFAVPVFTWTTTLPTTSAQWMETLASPFSFARFFTTSFLMRHPENACPGIILESLAISMHGLTETR